MKPTIHPVARFLIAVLTIVFLYPAILKAQIAEVLIKHPIEVEKISNWCPNYLTITDVFRIDNETNQTFTFAGFVQKCSANDGTIVVPKEGQIILSVNGESAYEKSAEWFYDKINEGPEFTIEFVFPGNDDVSTLSAQALESLKESLSELVPVNSIIKRNTLEFPHANTVLDALRGPTRIESRAIEFDAMDILCEEMNSETFDFSQCFTFDYLITGADPLADERILEKIPKIGMMRDKDNPDILFTIAKRVEDNISATYVPPSSRTVNTGSYTTSQYNYITHRYDYITRQNNETVTEGGFTRKTSQNDYYLELTALDTKKLDDPSLTYAPVVWKMTVSRHVIDGQGIKPVEELCTYASYACFSLNSRHSDVSRAFVDRAGIQGIGSDILYVVPNSRAERAGFKAGDEIISAKTKVLYWEWHWGNGNSFNTEKSTKYTIKASDVFNIVNWFDTTTRLTVEEELVTSKNIDTAVNTDIKMLLGEVEPWKHVGYIPGWAPAYQDWEVTVRRNGKKIKLNLPHAERVVVLSHSHL